MTDGKSEVTQEMRWALIDLDPVPTDPGTPMDWLREAYAQERATGRVRLVNHFARELDLDASDPEVRERILRAAAGWYGEDESVTFRRIGRQIKRRHDPVVYYMRQGGLVKIGTSESIASRLETIQPQGVMALELGDRTLEQQRHHEFAHLHDHTEWFRLEPDLGAHIADVREQFETATGSTVEAWLAQRLPPRRRRRLSD